MGIDPFYLQRPEIARLLSKETRKAEKISTPEECRERAVLKDERELQKLVYSWLNLEGLYFDWDSMHKARSGTIGSPDFIFPYKPRNRQTGYFVAWECKPPWSTKLRPEQATVRDKIIAQGGQWRVITSLSEAQQHLRELDAKPL